MSVELPCITVVATAHPPRVGPYFPSMSSPLMNDAAMHARRVYELEQRGPYGTLKVDDDAWHRSLTIAGVMLAASAVEAYANEVFLRPDAPFAGLFQTAARAEITRRWGLPKKDGGLETLHPLAKLDAALKLAGKHALDRGSAGYQQAQLAFKLRNGLVHFKTKATPAVTQQSDPHGELELQLEKCSFINVSYWPSTSPLFPWRCFSHACLEWAIMSHLALVDEFARLAGVPSLNHWSKRALRDDYARRTGSPPPTGYDAGWNYDTR